MENVSFNVNRVIDQLCAVNHTNGTLQHELEVAETEILNLKRELELARKEIDAKQERIDQLTAECEETDRLFHFTYDQRDKYERLYDELLASINAKGTEGASE